jgi:hypothetical protein
MAGMDQTLLTLTRRAVARVRAFALARRAPGIAPGSAVGDWHVAPQRTPAGVTRDSVQLTVSTGPDQRAEGPVAIARLRGLTAGTLGGTPGPVRFTLVGAAGTAALTGHAGGGSGAGTFRFTPDPGFAALLRERGVRGQAGAFALCRLTLMDTRGAEVDALLRALARGGHALPDVAELVHLVHDGVDEHLIADLGDAGLRGLTPADLLRLVGHGVDGGYVRAGARGGARRRRGGGADRPPQPGRVGPGRRGAAPPRPARPPERLTA